VSIGGLGVVLGRWAGGGPWFGGSGVRGLSLVGSLAGGYLGRGGVLAPEGPAPPSVWAWGSFFLGFIHFGVGGWPSVSKKIKIKIHHRKNGCRPSGATAHVVCVLPFAIKYSLLFTLVQILLYLTVIFCNF
jgi:hypothetical protein